MIKRVVTSIITVAVLMGSLVACSSESEVKALQDRISELETEIRNLKATALLEIDVASISLPDFGEITIEIDENDQIKRVSVIENIITSPFDSGERVRQWQSVLNDLGYELVVDGNFGNKTLTATLDFQNKTEIKPGLGVVDIKTWEAATDLPHPPIPLPEPTPTPLPRPTPTPRLADPDVVLGCGDFSEDWDSARVSFGKRYWPTSSSSTSDGSSIASLKVDYGDGTSYTSFTFDDVQKNLFWHVYNSPGTYTAVATYILTNGESTSDSCTFTWERSNSYYSPGVTSSPYIYSPPSSRFRLGAICNDGTLSSATGSGACSWHGGVSIWR